MASTLSPSEEAQLAQTIEMFEVITQSQPQDYQSLEILKEAYSKLGREKDVVSTSKRIAQAYVQMGQLSSAILEYETILQRYPDDPDVQAGPEADRKQGQQLSRRSRCPADTVLLAKAPPRPRQRPRKPPAKPPRRRSRTGGSRCTSFLSRARSSPPGDFDLCWADARSCRRRPAAWSSRSSRCWPTRAFCPWKNR